MEEEKIKQVLDEGQQQQKKQQQKRGFLTRTKTVKGKALSAWLIVMVLIFMLFTFGLGVYFGKEVFIDKNKSNTANPNSNIEIEPKPSVDEIELEKLARLDETDYSEWFNPLLVTNGVVNDLENEQKIMLIFRYAGKVGKIEGITYQTDPEGCSEAGSGQCSGIKISDFNDIAKKYGITNIDTTKLTSYKEMYVYSFGGDLESYKITHNLTKNYNGDDYVIVDEMNLTSSYEEYPAKDVTKEYTFKKYEDGSYYLYSVINK